jgi:hypothetical protein
MRNQAQGSIGLLAVLSSALLLWVSPAHAQTTWGSLHFGMTLAQARAALSGKVISEQYSPSTVTMVARPVRFGSTSGEPRLIFDSGSSKLVKIIWDFSIAAQGCFENYDSKLNAKRFLTVGEIGTKFSDRYGSIVSEKGSWPTPDQLYDHFVGRKETEEFSCERLYKRDEQTIKVSLHIHCDNVALLVEYAPEP